MSRREVSNSKCVESDNGYTWIARNSRTACTRGLDARGVSRRRHKTRRDFTARFREASNSSWLRATFSQGLRPDGRLYGSLVRRGVVTIIARARASPKDKEDTREAYAYRPSVLNDGLRSIN